MCSTKYIMLELTVISSKKDKKKRSPSELFCFSVQGLSHHEWLWHYELGPVMAESYQINQSLRRERYGLIQEARSVQDTFNNLARLGIIN